MAVIFRDFGRPKSGASARTSSANRSGNPSLVRMSICQILAAELDESEPFEGEATVVFDTPKARLSRRYWPVDARFYQPESRIFYRSEIKL